MTDMELIAEARKFIAPDTNMRFAFSTSLTFIEELADALSAHQWRPIETAPRDGTPVLVAVACHPFDPDIAHYEDGVFGFLTDNLGFSRMIEQPTHWMPLPNPPEE